MDLYVLISPSLLKKSKELISIIHCIGYINSNENSQNGTMFESKHLAKF